MCESADLSPSKIIAGGSCSISGNPPQRILKDRFSTTSNLIDTMRFTIQSTFISLLAWITLTLAVPQASVVNRTNTAAHAAGKLYFGSATDTGDWNDSTYIAILSDNTLFGQLSPENAMKWVRSDTLPPLWIQTSYTGRDRTRTKYLHILGRRCNC